MVPRHSRPVIAKNAVGVGLAALIPLPFVDEYVRHRLLRSSYRAAALDVGVTLDPGALDTLVREQGSLVWMIVKAIFFWPVKKLFRTILYFLTIKDVLDWATEGAIRAEMVHMAAASGALPAEPAAVRERMDGVLERHRFSPVTRWLFGGERPPMAWPAGSSALVGGVETLVRWGGGAVILAAFGEALGAQGSPSGAGDGR